VSKFFAEDGTPVWLPADYDSRDVFDMVFVETTELDGTKTASIHIEMHTGMEIEKFFAADEYPVALDTWRWFKNRWEVDHSE
jgi:hypothetical protein